MAGGALEGENMKRSVLLLVAITLLVGPTWARRGGIRLVGLAATSNPGELQRVLEGNPEKVFLRVSCATLKVGTEVRARWLLQADEENPTMQTTQVEKGDATLQFVLDRPEEGWAWGGYQVSLHSGGREHVKLDFVLEPPPDQPNPFKYLKLIEDLKTMKESDTYGTQDKVYLLMGSSKLEAGRPLRVVWTARKAKGLAPHEWIGTSDRVVEPGRDTYSTLKPPRKGYRPGSYYATVYYGRQWVARLPFTIEK